MTSEAARFALWGSTIALAAAAAATPFVVFGDWTTLVWGFLGWLFIAVLGVLGGVFLVSRHGRTGAGFPVALVVCMLARLVGLAAGMGFAAAIRGNEAVGAYLAGFAVGYVPTQTFEVIWFVRRGAGTPASSSVGAVSAPYQH